VTRRGGLPPIDKVDEGLYQFCTVAQLEKLEAIEKHGSMRAAARALGVNYHAVAEALATVKRKAAAKGYSPEHDMTRQVPEPFIVKGVSTYYDKDGKPAGQWVKSSLDEQKLTAARRAAIEAMAEEIPRQAPLPAPKTGVATLCNVYTLTDSHVGMLAWGDECGEDWDLKIAEATLVGCFEAMVAAAPPAKVAVVNQLGDFLHYDSAVAAVTPTSGHALDADGRMPKMVRTAIRILRRVVDMALMKHGRVVLLLAEGNHDLAGSVWLRAMFAALYENEPRITVIDSELPYYSHQHGETMLAFHHGHLTKNDQLPILFASQFPKVWGATTKRYCHTGHRHHVEEKEHSGMTVFQHPTLASRDAYAARGGWIARRQVTAITYHSKFGEVARNTVCPEMLGSTS
jgi:hypothetical protein